MLSIKGLVLLVLLEKTYEMMDDRGYEISNLDAIILIEKPRWHLISKNEGKY